MARTLHQTTKLRLFQSQSKCRLKLECMLNGAILSLKGCKHCGKRIKCWSPAPSSFSAMFSKHLTLVKKLLDSSKLKVVADRIQYGSNYVFFSLNRLEILWEKEKILTTSIFFYSCDVFESLILCRGRGIFKL